MIRDAVKDDIPQLVELGKLMHAEAARMRRLGFVPGKVFVMFSRLIDSEDGFVRVVEQDGEIIGGLAASISEHWFSLDRIAEDRALFIRPDRRGGVAAARLITEYKAWARDKGAVITQMGISTGVHLASTSELIQRLGFKPSGFLFDAE